MASAASTLTAGQAAAIKSMFSRGPNDPPIPKTTPADSGVPKGLPTSTMFGQPINRDQYGNVTSIGKKTASTSTGGGNTTTNPGGAQSGADARNTSYANGLTGANGGLGSLNTGAAASGSSKKSSTDYPMLYESRYSESQIENLRDFYGKMKGGRTAPAAQLLSPYRGYGGPRSTAIGNPNVQTATKMLLGN